jgi:two-component system nitrogen regulation response regulator NtrX
MKIKNVLIIDDNDVHVNGLKLLIETLNISNIKIIVAKDGLEGLCKASNQDFDLIICDNYMPKVSGIKFVSLFLKNKKTNPNKIIFISGPVDKPDFFSIASLGIKNIFIKPFDNSKLCFLMKNILEN